MTPAANPEGPEDAAATDSDPAGQVSPQMRKSIAATRRIVEGVRNEFGLLTESEADERLEANAVSSLGGANDLRNGGSLLAIRMDGQDLYPGFQFDDDGSPVASIALLRSLCLVHGWSQGDLFLWLVIRTGPLADRRPIDALHDEDDGEQRVLRAVEHAMTEQW